MTPCSSHRSLCVAVIMNEIKDGFSSTKNISARHNSIGQLETLLTQLGVCESHVFPIIKRLLDGNIHNGHEVGKLIL